MISVIIPTANRPGPLHRALRSLARQSYKDFEVVIVRDGGVTVRSVVDSWRDELRITLVDLQESGGVSRARNRGLDAASGDYIAFLDDDDIFFSNHLQLAYRTLQSDDVDLVYGGALVSPTWLEACPRTSQALQRKDYPFDADFLLVANFIHTGSVVARNFTDTQVRFTEQLVHCEDWNMWLSLNATLSYRLAYLGEMTSVYHQVPRSRGTVSAAYQTSPTPFTLARAFVYSTWLSTNAQVTDYRSWFQRFDQRLDYHIKHQLPIPSHVYERAVRGLYPLFMAGKSAPPALLDAIFSHQ